MNVPALTPRREFGRRKGVPSVGTYGLRARGASRLGWALHFARRTYSNRFARIQPDKKSREEDLGFTLVMRTIRKERTVRVALAEWLKWYWHTGRVDSQPPISFSFTYSWIKFDSVSNQLNSN